MATQAKVFPLYEVKKWGYAREHGSFEEKWNYTINVKPDRELPLKEYLKFQGRFRLMTDDMIADAQQRVNLKWEDLLEKEAGAQGA
jgi:pyruvate/2-oxoacid:ferredoxin oxidoreductase beta subunit